MYHFCYLELRSHFLLQDGFLCAVSLQFLLSGLTNEPTGSGVRLSLDVPDGSWVQCFCRYYLVSLVVVALVSCMFLFCL
jgi:hypothetical protein